MKSQIPTALLLTLALILGSGCVPAPESAGVVVIDLVAIAKATGHDEVLDRQVEAARRQLESQLTQIAGDLEQQLQAEQKRLGGAEAAARRQEFQDLTAQARQQLAQSQVAAQQRAQEFQQELVRQYRQAIQPVAVEVAKKRGAGVVLVVDPSMLWFEPTRDITAEVIAAVRARDIQLPGAGTEPPSAGERPPAAGSPAEASAG